MIIIPWYWYHVTIIIYSNCPIIINIYIYIFFSYTGILWYIIYHVTFYGHYPYIHHHPSDLSSEGRRGDAQKFFQAWKKGAAQQRKAQRRSFRADLLIDIGMDRRYTTKCLIYYVYIYICMYIYMYICI